MTLLSKNTLQIADGVFLDCDPKKPVVILRIGAIKKTIKKKELWAACFAIADAKVQDEMMPVRKTEMSVFVRQHTIRVTKPMVEGETIQVKCNINIPEIVKEGIARGLSEEELPAGGVVTEKISTLDKVSEIKK